MRYKIHAELKIFAPDLSCDKARFLYEKSYGPIYLKLKEKTAKPVVETVVVYEKTSKLRLLPSFMNR